MKCASNGKLIYYELTSTLSNTPHTGTMLKGAAQKLMSIKQMEYNKSRDVISSINDRSDVGKPDISHIHNYLIPNNLVIVFLCSAFPS